MKLEFESNAVSSPLVGNQVPTEFESKEASPEVLETLKEGIAAAQAGNRPEARTLLMKVTEVDPNNENAWLWLASISEYPEELLVFLNNVLQINPDNERAKEWSVATKSLIAKTFVQRGIDAAKDEQSKFAKQCFLQAIVHDSNSELAWLWLASVSESTDEKISHLQRVLQINPENENAKSSLKSAREKGARTLLPKANSAAISGNRELAGELLEKIFNASPDFEDAWMLKAHISESFAEKIAAFERVLEINPENQVARANVESLRMFENNQEQDDEPQVGFEGARYQDEDGSEAADPMQPTESYAVEEMPPVESAPAEVEVTDSSQQYFEDVAPAVADQPEPAGDLAVEHQEVVFEESVEDEEVVFGEEEVSLDVEQDLDHDYQETAVDVSEAVAAPVVEEETVAAQAVEDEAQEVASTEAEEDVAETASDESADYDFHADESEEYDEPEVSEDFAPVESDEQAGFRSGVRSRSGRRICSTRRRAGRRRSSYSLG